MSFQTKVEAWIQHLSVLNLQDETGPKRASPPDTLSNHHHKLYKAASALAFTEEQIIAILREQEAGARTADVCRRHGLGDATFYKWRTTAVSIGWPQRGAGSATPSSCRV